MPPKLSNLVADTGIVRSRRSPESKASIGGGVGSRQEVFERRKEKNPMEETFERVTERHGENTFPVKHLYRRQYQTAGGEWRTVFYAIFTDWQGKRRKFPLGSNLDDARDELGRLRT